MMRDFSLRYRRNAWSLAEPRLVCFQQAPPEGQVPPQNNEKKAETSGALVAKIKEIMKSNDRKGNALKSVVSDVLSDGRITTEPVNEMARVADSIVLMLPDKDVELANLIPKNPDAMVDFLIQELNLMLPSELGRRREDAIRNERAREQAPQQQVNAQVAGRNSSPDLRLQTGGNGSVRWVRVGNRRVPVLIQNQGPQQPGNAAQTGRNSPEADQTGVIASLPQMVRYRNRWVFAPPQRSARNVAPQAPNVPSQEGQMRFAESILDNLRRQGRDLPAEGATTFTVENYSHGSIPYDFVEMAAIGPHGEWVVTDRKMGRVEPHPDFTPEAMAAKDRVRDLEREHSLEVLRTQRGRPVSDAERLVQLRRVQGYTTDEFGYPLVSQFDRPRVNPVHVRLNRTLGRPDNYPVIDPDFAVARKKLNFELSGGSPTKPLYIGNVPYLRPDPLRDPRGPLLPYGGMTLGEFLASGGEAGYRARNNPGAAARPERARNLGAEQLGRNQEISGDALASVTVFDTRFNYGERNATITIPQEMAPGPLRTISIQDPRTWGRGTVISDGGVFASRESESLARDAGIRVVPVYHADGEKMRYFRIEFTKPGVFAVNGRPVPATQKTPSKPRDEEVAKKPSPKSSKENPPEQKSKKAPKKKMEYAKDDDPEPTKQPEKKEATMESIIADIQKHLNGKFIGSGLVVAPSGTEGSAIAVRSANKALVITTQKNPDGSRTISELAVLDIATKTLAAGTDETKLQSHVTKAVTPGLIEQIVRENGMTLEKAASQPPKPNKPEAPKKGQEKKVEDTSAIAKLATATEGIDAEIARLDLVAMEKDSREGRETKISLVEKFLQKGDLKALVSKVVALAAYRNDIGAIRAVEKVENLVSLLSQAKDIDVKMREKESRAALARQAFGEFPIDVSTSREQINAAFKGMDDRAFLKGYLSLQPLDLLLVDEDQRPYVNSYNQLLVRVQAEVKQLLELPEGTPAYKQTAERAKNLLDAMPDETFKRTTVLGKLQLIESEAKIRLILLS